MVDYYWPYNLVIEGVAETSGKVLRFSFPVVGSLARASEKKIF